MRYTVKLMIKNIIEHKIINETKVLSYLWTFWHDVKNFEFQLHTIPTFIYNNQRRVSFEKSTRKNRLKICEHNSICQWFCSVIINGTLWFRLSTKHRMIFFLSLYSNYCYSVGNFHTQKINYDLCINTRTKFQASCVIDGSIRPTNNLCSLILKYDIKPWLSLRSLFHLLHRFLI